MDGSGIGEENEHPDSLSPGSSTGSAPAIKPKAGSKEPDPDAPPKKKRKQLVACDSCRLRRVKCNKADVAGADCSECVKKSIRCTDSYIRTKPKVVRSGKLIQQAKILYGNGDSKPYIKDESPGNSPKGYGGHTPPSSVVRAAEARFMNTELARSISDHLVQVFHQYVHSQCSVVDWEHFEANWDAAGHVSEAMTPTGECLSLVMQAWAARFSDHSAIVGQGAPALTDIENVPLGSDFTPYGKARDAFARAMQDRAMKMLDHHGALRRPSGQCCAALVLMEFLITWGDVYRNDGRHLMTAAVEHLRSRNDGLSDDPTEEYGPEMRMSGGTLFWVVYTRDALSSAFGGRAVALTTEDLSVLCEILASPITLDVMPYVSSDDPRTLGGLATVAVFRHITSVVRSFCVKISGPLPRRSRLDINAIHEMWTAVDDCQHFSDVWQQSMTLHPVPTSSTWFRDLTTMRSQLTHAIHIAIVDRLELEKSRAASTRDPSYIPYIDHLERLRQQSEERFLICCRSMARLIRSVGTSLVFVCAMGAENLPLYMAHMISMPVWEQGGLESWTSAAKQEEVGWMIDGVKLLGWSWPNFKLHSDAAEETLRDLAEQVAHARRTAAQQQGGSRHESSSSFDLHDMQQQQQQALYPPQLAPQQQPWYPDPQFQHVAPPAPPPTGYAQPYAYPAHPQQPPPTPSHQQRASTSHGGSISSQHSSQHSQHSQPQPLGLQTQHSSGQYYPADPNGPPSQQLFYEAPSRDAQGYEYGWDGSNGDGLS